MFNLAARCQRYFASPNELCVQAALKRLLHSWLGMEFNPEFRGNERKQT
jgi:hypothetical protein